MTVYSTKQRIRGREACQALAKEKGKQPLHLERRLVQEEDEAENDSLVGNWEDCPRRTSVYL